KASCGRSSLNSCGNASKRRCCPRNGFSGGSQASNKVKCIRSCRPFSWGFPGRIRSGRIPSLIHHTESCDKPPNPRPAKGRPLSLRMTSGSPCSRKGAPISPILANVFLHIVLDEWFQNEVRPRMKGNCFMVRFADDFVAGFSLKGDAERVFKVLPKRFERYGLKI